MGKREFSGSRDVSNELVNKRSSKKPTKRHKCLQCPKAYLYRALLIIHERTNSGEKPFICQICERGFVSERLLNLHLPFHDKPVFQCEHCSSKFNAKAKLEDHIWKKHTRHSCNICGKTYPTKPVLDMHLQVHNPRHECPTCGKKFPVRHQLVTHQHIHTGELPFGCKFCPKRFIGRIALNSHLKIHDRSRRPYICSICQQGFVREFSLRAHMQISHNQQGSAPVHECLFCLKKVRSNAEYMRHVRVHTREKPFFCGICRDAFSMKGDLSKHNQKKHVQKRATYPCNFCEKRFFTRGGRRSHLITHTNEKHYRCEICLKRFTQPGSLKEHIGSHVGEKNYQCKFCKKRFKCSSSHWKHENLHKGVERRYKCTQCEKTFFSKRILTEHVRIHTGEKPFGCVFCKRKCRTESLLFDHIRFHVQEKPYNCEFCEESFGRATSYCIHKMKRHN